MAYSWTSQHLINRFFHLSWFGSGKLEVLIKVDSQAQGAELTGISWTGFLFLKYSFPSPLPNPRIFKCQSYSDFFLGKKNK